MAGWQKKSYAATTSTPLSRATRAMTATGGAHQRPNPWPALVAHKDGSNVGAVGSRVPLPPLDPMKGDMRGGRRGRGRRVGVEGGGRRTPSSLMLDPPMVAHEVARGDEVLGRHLD